jgi:hypothetical protein
MSIDGITAGAFVAAGGGLRVRLAALEMFF